MRDISDALTASAETIINRHEERVRQLLDELQTAHAEFAADISALGAATDAQIRNRVRAVRTKQQELVDHLSGLGTYEEPMRIGGNSVEQPP